MNINTGKDIINILNKYVEGQEEAKEMLAACVTKHILKSYKHKIDGIKSFCKTSSLILGPTGCGKTYMVDVLKEHLDIPIVNVNGADITSNGWSGTSLEDLIKIEKRKTGESNLAYGIVFIDEIDKLCMSRTSSSGTDHNKAVQYSLLKSIEGQTLTDNNGTFIVDTTNVTFIFGGNFKELRDKLKDKKSSIGFKQDDEKEMDIEEIHQELIAMGMVPELAGRISMISEVKQLTREQIKKIILNQEAGALSEYNSLFRFYGVQEVELTEDGLNTIIDTVMSKDVGARGITSAIDKIMQDRILELDVNKKTDTNKEWADYYEYYAKYYDYGWQQ